MDSQSSSHSRTVDPGRLEEADIANWVGSVYDHTSADEPENWRWGELRERQQRVSLATRLGNRISYAVEESLRSK
jgi:hypothetical protein